MSRSSVVKRHITFTALHSPRFSQVLAMSSGLSIAKGYLAITLFADFGRGLEAYETTGKWLLNPGFTKSLLESLFFENEFVFQEPAKARRSRTHCSSLGKR